MNLNRDVVELWEDGSRVDGKLIEKVSDPAVWELMYFGKTSADEKYNEKNK